MTIRAQHRRSDLEDVARRVLLERQRTLTDVLGHALKEARELYETREPDWEDQAANTSAAVGLDRIGDRERAQLLGINAALARLDAGTWGRCTRCGGSISNGRLRAVPEATRCAKCKTLSG
jgi:RNA polymerase-binding protein DksA